MSRGGKGDFCTCVYELRDGLFYNLFLCFILLILSY